MDRYPMVVWMGSNPIQRASNRRYRVVYRGPARPGRPDDTPFAVEQRIGQSSMKRLNWAKPNRDSGAEEEALWAVGHAFGQVLMADPARLTPGHPIHCELNMAAIEGREPRGCDCHGPAEPEEAGVQAPAGA
jgi:hypothetical protein